MGAFDTLKYYPKAVCSTIHEEVSQKATKAREAREHKRLVKLGQKAMKDQMREMLEAQAYQRGVVIDREVKAREAAEAEAKAREAEVPTTEGE